MMTHIPQPKRTQEGKVEGEFYPLQREELIALKKAKLINNSGYVHLALRYENPYCNKPIEIIPKEFSVRWCIPESSVYEAIAKLKEAGAISIKSGKIVLEWVHCQQATNSENPESLRNSRKNSGSSEKILESQKILRDSRKNSGKSENRGSKPYPDKGSRPSKINKNYLDFLDSLSDTERENFLNFGKKKASELPKLPALPEKWITANHKELYEQFLASTEGKAAKKEAIASQHNWPNDPRYNAWLEKAFHEGMQWVEADEAEREQRWAFYQWAQYTEPSPFEGVYI